MDWVNHELNDKAFDGQVLYERKPVYGPDGQVVEGLSAVWITLNNPTQLNSYTTDMVKDVILAFRRASNDMRREFLDVAEDARIRPSDLDVPDKPAVAPGSEAGEAAASGTEATPTESPPRPPAEDPEAEAGADVEQVLVADDYGTGSYIAILDEDGSLSVALDDVSVMENVTGTFLVQVYDHFPDAVHLRCIRAGQSFSGILGSQGAEGLQELPHQNQIRRNAAATRVPTEPTEAS